MFNQIKRASRGGDRHFDLPDIERQQSVTDVPITSRFASMSFTTPQQRRQQPQTKRSDSDASDGGRRGFSLSSSNSSEPHQQMPAGLLQPLLQGDGGGSLSAFGSVVSTTDETDCKNRGREGVNQVASRRKSKIDFESRPRMAGLMRRSSVPALATVTVTNPSSTVPPQVPQQNCASPFIEHVRSELLHGESAERHLTDERPTLSSQLSRLWRAVSLQRRADSDDSVLQNSTAEDGRECRAAQQEGMSQAGSAALTSDGSLGSMVPMRSPHSATLALLHTKAHNYGRGPVKANVLRHNVAGDLIIPSRSLVRITGPGKSDLLTPRIMLSSDSFGELDDILQATDPRANLCARWAKHMGVVGAFLTLLVAGLWLLLEHQHMEDVLGMQLWRWALWGAASLGLALASSIVADASIMACERWYVSNQKLFYFTVYLKEPGLNLVKVLQTAGAFVLLCKSHDPKMDFLYTLILRLLQCMCLFSGTQLLKVTAARGAAAVFYRSSFFGTVYDAVIKEHFLQRLAEPSSSVWDNGSDLQTNDSTAVPDVATSRDQVTALRSASMLQVPATPRELRDEPAVLRRAEAAPPKGVWIAPSQKPAYPVMVPKLPSYLAEDATDALLAKNKNMARAPAHTGRKERGHPTKSRGGSMEKALLKLQKKNSLGVRSSVAEVMLSDKVCKALSSKAEICPKQVAADARQVALYIFWNLKSEFDATCITRADLERVLQAHEATRFMELLHIKQDETITLSTLKKAVLDVYQDRHKLALQISDRNSISGLLESLLGVLLHTISILAYLYIFNVDFSSMWIALSSVMLAMSFVFGNSMRGMFESILYLLVVNAFDVGDTIELNGGVTYKVEAVNLMVATLLHSDGQRVYYPIQGLASAPLSNLSRSQNRSESWRVTLDRAELDCEAVVREIQRCMRSLACDNGSSAISAPWQVSLAPNRIPTKVDMLLRFTFRSSGEDALALNEARGVLVSKLGGCLDTLGVRYSLPPQAIHKFKHLP